MRTASLLVLLTPFVLAAGCSNGTSNNADMAALASPDLIGVKPGGPVTGAADVHCNTDGGLMVQSTSQASCMYKPDGGGDAVVMYGDTMYGSEGNDDDCKYHVKFTVPAIYQNQNVTFTVSATQLGGSTAVTGAKTRAEVFLNNMHPAPNSNQNVTESPAGTYAVGPIQFDASGRWTVRFHFFEDCYDFADDSPHGHAAFYIDVF